MHWLTAMNDDERILIIEPYASGHRMTYVRWIVEGLLREGRRVVIATSRRAIDNPVLAGLRASHDSRVEFHIERQEPSRSSLPGVMGLVARQWHVFRWYRDASRAAASTRHVVGVVLPYIDESIYAFALLGSPFGKVPLVAVTMRTTFDSSGARVSSRARTYVVRRVLALRGLAALFSINGAGRSRPGATLPGGLRYLPDPAEVRQVMGQREARSALAIPQHAFVLLVFGTVDERKGLRALLRGLEFGRDARRVVLLVAGVQSASIRELLASEPYAAWRSDGRIVTIDRFMDDADVGCVLAAADAVWVGYVGHEAMSGVVVLAGRACKPVVACAHGEIGRLVKGEGIGEVVDVEDADAVAAGISRLLAPLRYSECADRSKSAFIEHTPEIFSSTLLGPLLEMLRDMK